MKVSLLCKLSDLKLFITAENEAETQFLHSGLSEDKSDLFREGSLIGHHYKNCRNLKLRNLLKLKYLEFGGF